MAITTRAKTTQKGTLIFFEMVIKSVIGKIAKSRIIFCVRILEINTKADTTKAYDSRSDCCQ